MASYGRRWRRELNFIMYPSFSRVMAKSNNNIFFGSDRSSGCHFVTLSVCVSVRDKVV